LFLDFTTGLAGGTCGDVRDSTNAIIKNLTCGGLNLGGGHTTVQEGPTPDGSTNRFALGCTGPVSGQTCALGSTDTAPAVNSADPDCTAEGCNFGAPLAIPNPAVPILTTCVLNTFAHNGSGSSALPPGPATTFASLISDTYLTGNLGQPCPACVSGGMPVNGSPSSPQTGTCDRGPRTGMPCTSTNSTGLTRDCLTGGADAMHPCSTPPNDSCIDGTHVGPINVNLSPLGTGLATKTNSAGNFCPGQPATPGTSGCFGTSGPPFNKLCTTINEQGAGAPVVLNVPTAVKLSSVFCISATASGTVNFAADLPGPGAVSLPGTYLAHP